MPREKFIGNDRHHDMACHVFALSGDPDAAAAINTRYARLGDLLFGVEDVPVDDEVADGLAVVTNNDIWTSPGAGQPPAQVAPRSLTLLCREFGFTPQEGSGIRLWGRFLPGQVLPQHMYVTTPGGRIWDTMPEMPVYRRINKDGRNPGAEGDAPNGQDIMLAPDEVFSIEVAALAPKTREIIETPDDQWEKDIEDADAGQAERNGQGAGGDFIGDEDENALNDS
ncbi:hypothetical protein [Azospirillum tabaci]|uniref:hypothetical protein n=1 Tax=Azospirillum tabaci TaxID=2752310 RepID=UPI001660D4D1|nr:hypothetical protein [Azospirillum tabaci]